MITREQAFDVLTPSELEEIAHIEEAIDVAIRLWDRRFPGIEVVLKEYPSIPVRNELAKRAANAGWQLTYETDDTPIRLFLS